MSSHWTNVHSSNTHHESDSLKLNLPNLKCEVVGYNSETSDIVNYIHVVRITDVIAIRDRYEIIPSLRLSAGGWCNCSWFQSRWSTGHRARRLARNDALKKCHRIWKWWQSVKMRRLSTGQPWLMPVPISALHAFTDYLPYLNDSAVIIPSQHHFLYIYMQNISQILTLKALTIFVKIMETECFF